MDGFEKYVGGKIYKRGWLSGCGDSGKGRVEYNCKVFGLGNWMDGGVINRENYRV